MSDPVLIVEYDPLWASAFKREREAICQVLRDFDVRIEHIGSTSVPGLAAKPIIDILMIVADATQAVQIITPLFLHGYECLGEYGIPGRVYFRKGKPQTHHIHLYWRGNPEIERHLNYRDYLRAHPDARDAYAELKIVLAEKFRNDRPAYTDAKTEFIRGIDALAAQEFGTGK